MQSTNFTITCHSSTRGPIETIKTASTLCVLYTYADGDVTHGTRAKKENKEGAAAYAAAVPPAHAAACALCRAGPALRGAIGIAHPAPG